VFAGADWVTGRHAVRMRVHLDAELGIPLVPSFLVAYMSIYLLFVGVPFVLRTRREVASLAIALALTILVAGVGFLLVPATLAWSPAPDVGHWAPLLRLADRMNLTYDLVPSLHVAMSVVCIEAFARRAGQRTTVLLRGWGILIAASTVLTHQHHLLDAITGYALALVIARRRDWAPLAPQERVAGKVGGDAATHNPSGALGMG
jgi:membrane-associated phospholipid phosphatase